MYYECDNPVDLKGVFAGGDSEDEKTDPFANEDWVYNADGTSFKKTTKK